MQMLLVLGLHQPLLRFPGHPFYVYRVFASQQTWKMAEEDSVMCIPTIFTPDMGGTMVGTDRLNVPTLDTFSH